MHAMNRAWQVKQTLRHNLEACEAHELILANYGSTDDLDEWVRDEFSGDIRAGRLVYFHTTEPARFHASKSKNLAHHLATGDVVFTCDGDNFVTSGDLQRILAVFERQPDSVVHNLTGNATDGTWGRIALRRTDFARLGGYDEGLLPIAAQDLDLVARAIQMGLQPVRISEVDRLPIRNTLADKTPLDGGLGYADINELNINLCFSRQKVLGPVRELQTHAYRGTLNLSPDLHVVEPPLAETHAKHPYANHPAREPGRFVLLWQGFRAHLQKASERSTLSWLESLHRSWGNQWAMHPSALLKVHEAARECETPILECGSGLSSLVLAASTRQRVVSLESDSAWKRDMEFIRQVLNLDNLEIVYAPLKVHDKYDWYDYSPGETQSFSLVVCDGPPASTRGGRSGLAAQLHSYLAPGFKILLDDAQRRDQQQALSAWARILGPLNATVDRKPSEKMMAIITRGA